MFEIFLIPENLVETNGKIILPKRGTNRHNALFRLGMVRKIQFHEGDFEYCKSQILMAFTEDPSVPNFLTSMAHFVFYSSSGNGTTLVEAPSARISPTNFTIDDLNRLVSLF